MQLLMITMLMTVLFANFSFASDEEADDTDYEAEADDWEDEDENWDDDSYYEGEADNPSYEGEADDPSYEGEADPPSNTGETNPPAEEGEADSSDNSAGESLGGEATWTKTGSGSELADDNETEIRYDVYTLKVTENGYYEVELASYDDENFAAYNYLQIYNGVGGIKERISVKNGKAILKLKASDEYQLTTPLRILGITRISDEEGEAAEGAVDASTPEETVTPHDVGVAEKTFTMYFLEFGDYAQRFLRDIFGEEITIDALVYNKVMSLNANFFVRTPNSAGSDMASRVRTFISQMYNIFKKIAIVAILIGIAGAGVRILLKTPQAKVKAMETLTKVFMATMLIFFFPYVMRFAFDINEAIINYISKKQFSDDVVYSYALTPASKDGDEELEFRSPEYVSLEDGILIYSSDSLNKIYIRKIQEYMKKINVMRLMRLYAGVTYRFSFIIIWYIMLAQIYILSFIYLKRFFTLAFLITIYPWTVVMYVVDTLSAKRKGAFNNWCKKFFSTIFLQTMHAAMYGIISGILMNQVIKSEGGLYAAKINVILMIVATSFLFSGEKMIKTFWKNSIDSSEERKGLRQIFGMPKRMIGSFKGK